MPKKSKSTYLISFTGKELEGFTHVIDLLLQELENSDVPEDHKYKKLSNLYKKLMPSALSSFLS